MATSGFGQDFVPVDVMVPKSTVVGVAVVRGEKVWLEPTNNVIYTSYEVKFTDVWKGDPSDPFLVTKVGGQLGERIASISNLDFQLKVGDTVVLFTHPNHLGKNVTIGIHQGVFRVEEGSDPLVHRILEGPNPTKPPLTLQALKERVYRASGRPWVPPSTTTPAPKDPKNSKAKGSTDSSSAEPGPGPATSEEPGSKPGTSERSAGMPIALIGGTLLLVVLTCIVLRKKSNIRTRNSP
jgi:hypothetical protein